jgi:hypothetical protein
MGKHLPSKKQRTELARQTLEIAIILAVICAATVLFTQNIVAGLLLYGLSLGSIVLYLLFEHKLEYEVIKSHRSKRLTSDMYESRANLLLWGIIIAGLAIGNFLLLFIRHGTTVGEIPPTALLYQDAVGLMFTTIVFCLLAHILHYRYHLYKGLGLVGIHKARTIKSYVLASFYTVAIISIAFLLTPYHSDLFFAVVAAVLYIAFREFQRYDRKNHRKAVHLLHHKITITK